MKQDLPFKLFGKTISLPAEKEAPSAVTETHQPQQLCSSSSSSTGEVCNRVDDEDVYDHKKPSQSGGPTEADHENGHVISNGAGEEYKDRAPSSSSSFDKPETPSADKEHTSLGGSKSDEASISEDTALKKPDKIIPCPRCNSMETKFCYHNNYNVNQPRHFCKKCQRYWTAGGTMRNVPVGSGRRKSKASCVSQYQHIVVSDVVRPHGTVLAFGSDAAICQLPSSVAINQDLRVDPEAMGGNLRPLPPHCFQGPPWALPWRPLQWGTPAMPPGTVSPPGYPMAFYPTPPYWGCGMPGTWTSAPPEQSSNVGEPSKREALKEKCSERRVWTPKTTRMDDQTEAAKRSIWSSLGVNSASHDQMNVRSSKRQRFETSSLVLQANPAAFSRSLNFREAV